MMSNPVKSDSRTFDWSNLNAFGFSIGRNTAPTLARSKSKRVIKKIQVSIPPELLHVIMINGFKVSPNGVSFDLKYSSIAHPDWRSDMALNKTCLNVELDTDAWQFTPLTDHFDTKEIQRIFYWVQSNERRLIQIGTEFESYEREIYHFLYDVTALFYALKSIPDPSGKEILNDIRGATDLYHGRILAETAAEYSNMGANVTLHPSNSGHVPDILIGNILIDVKTVLIVGKDRKVLMKEFAKRLRKDIIDRENKKQQIGNNGSFFIGIWSGIINSIIYTAFQNQLITEYDDTVRFYDTTPPLNPKKVILVMPTLYAFKNNYLVFDRDRICDIMDYLAGNGYQRIQEENAMKYLTRTNIRRNCIFGITSDNSECSFKFR